MLRRSYAAPLVSASPRTCLPGRTWTRTPYERSTASRAPAPRRYASPRDLHAPTPRAAPSRHRRSRAPASAAGPCSSPPHAYAWRQVFPAHHRWRGPSALQTSSVSCALQATQRRSVSARSSTAKLSRPPSHAPPSGSSWLAPRRPVPCRRWSSPRPGAPRGRPAPLLRRRRRRSAPGFQPRRVPIPAIPPCAAAPPVTPPRTRLPVAAGSRCPREEAGPGR